MKIIHRVASLLVAAAVSTGAGASPLVIKFAHVVAENTPKGQAALLFEKLAEEKLPGKVDVQIFPNGQLYNDNDVLLALLKGDVQIAAPALSKFSKFTDVLQLYDLPFLFDDLNAVDCFQSSVHGQEMLRSMTSKGIFGLGYWHNGMKQLSAARNLRVPSDAAGLKFRIMSSDVLQAQFQALDANPQKMAFTEVYQALQAGTVDGQENTWSNIYSKKFHEVQPAITESNHGLLDYMVVTSLRFWKGLPYDIREGLTQALAEASEVGNRLSYEQNLHARQSIADAGKTELLQLSNGERAQWRQAMRPVWNQFSKEIGADLIDAASACN
jgi:C4-dicarboxylate-binding protein DctP